MTWTRPRSFYRLHNFVSIFAFQSVDVFLLDQLPSEILLNIIGQFQPIDICKQFRRVSRRFRQLTYTPSLWKSVSMVIDVYQKCGSTRLLNKVACFVCLFYILLLKISSVIEHLIARSPTVDTIVEPIKPLGDRYDMYWIDESPVYDRWLNHFSYLFSCNLPSLTYIHFELYIDGSCIHHLSALLTTWSSANSLDVFEMLSKRTSNLQTLIIRNNKDDAQSMTYNRQLVVQQFVTRIHRFIADASVWPSLHQFSLKSNYILSSTENAQEALFNCGKKFTMLRISAVEYKFALLL